MISKRSRSSITFWPWIFIKTLYVFPLVGGLVGNSILWSDKVTERCKQSIKISKGNRFRRYRPCWAVDVCVADAVECHTTLVPPPPKNKEEYIYIEEGPPPPPSIATTTAAYLWHVGPAERNPGREGRESSTNAFFYDGNEKVVLLVVQEGKKDGGWKEILVMMMPLLFHLLNDRFLSSPSDVLSPRLRASLMHSTPLLCIRLACVELWRTRRNKIKEPLIFFFLLF